MVMVGLWGCASVQQVTARADVLGRDVVAKLQPYRVEIVQGNAITAEQVQAIRPGMTRQQVRSVLGSPMLADPFHADRWDYIFTIRRPGTPAQRLSVVLRFEGDQLKTIDAPANLPSENEFVTSIAPPSRRSGEPRPLELTEAQRKALPAPRAAEAAAANPAPPARSYPPLERP